MSRTLFDDFLLLGSIREGERFYVCRPGEDRNTWIAYDVQSGGQLANPRVVFGDPEATNWRGLPAESTGGALP